MVKSIRRCVAVTAVLLPAALTTAQDPPAADPGWPRSFEKDGTTVLLYQPQVDAWKDHEKIRFRCALEVTMAGADHPSYGVIAVQADTDVTMDDKGQDTVVLSNLQPAIRFGGMSDEEAAPLRAVVNEALPDKKYVTVALPRVLAYQHDQQAPPGVAVNLDPPKIYFSATPAILVNFVGQPQFKPIEGTKLMFAVNTNWAVLLDTSANRYYLLDDDSWLSAADPLAGPWTAAGPLPADFSNIPSDGTFDEVRKQVPGQPAGDVPHVYTSTEPAELILTKGTPEYVPIMGTQLMYVNNPAMPLFRTLSDSTYYYLVAGRWFHASSLSGPWSAASDSLPADFAAIPTDSPMSFVLASVPRTQEAKDAVLLASVPHEATVTIADAKCDVTYRGDPKFMAIEGTAMKYAVNTSEEVVLASGQYYCCYQGVWFGSSSPTGPWTVCTSIPAEIYTIPPSCPIYNVTYVKVYSSTPTTVVCGYTSGYSGDYVATTGTVMFGAGMLVGAAIANGGGCCWYGYPPCYYSYGCATYYHYGYGGYYRAAGGCYGPHGGAGWAAGYNPATGNYYRGGVAAGPGGARWAGQAYNPWTHTYGAHRGGTTGYRSWGGSYVQQGSHWAAAQHTSTAAGGAGRAVNSSGQWVEGAHSNVTNSTVARTSSGDLYAGHDGNVYRNTGSGWQVHGDGGWNDVQKPSGSAARPAAQPKSPVASAQSDWKNNWSGGGNSLQKSWQDRGAAGAGAQNAWSNHDTQSSLNHDAWARGQGNAGQAARSGQGWGGARDWSGGAGGLGAHGGWGGGARIGGGGFRGGGRFRR